MKQIDIFGGETDVEQLWVDNNPHITMKEKFRYLYGYKEGFTCQNCVYFREQTYHRRKYFKCTQLGVTQSEASDIRKKDTACHLYVYCEPYKEEK